MKIRLNKTEKDEDKVKKIKNAKDRYANENKKINDSKKKIRQEKEKIKEEKNNIKKKKAEKFGKTKVGKFFGKIGAFLNNDKDSYSFLEVCIITVFSLVVGAFSCFCLMILLSGGRNYFVLSKDLGKFVEVYDTITKNYYDDVDKEVLVEDAINGMVSSVGDIYTSYSDKDGADSFTDLVVGTYEGIGCLIQLREDGIMVIEVFQDGPADKAGMLAGDIILRVDDKDVSTMTVDEVAEYVKTNGDGNIKIVVSREGQEVELNLVRAVVETPVVNSYVYDRNDKKVGVLSISAFTSVAANQFVNKLKVLEKDGIDALVIDVRNNSGGYLMTVTDILSSILPKGEILYRMEHGDVIKPTKDKTSSKKTYPIAVLVNGGSASASEILAAAIKESYGGFVVGTRTYGKGTVQQVKKLSDGSMIKYTIEKWLTPEGIWINEVGVTPTDEVELSVEYYNNPVVENDIQLQKALELVSK